MIWYQENCERYQQEVTNLAKHGFREINKSEENGVTFEGTLNLCFHYKGRDYDEVIKLHLILPPHYPFEHPEIVPVDPKIEKSYHQNPITHYICVLEPALDKWRTSYYAYEYVRLSRAWFIKYITNQLETEGEPELTRYCVKLEKANWLIPASMFNVSGKSGFFNAINFNQYVGGIVSLSEISSDGYEGDENNFIGEFPVSLQNLARQDKKIQFTGIWVKLKNQPMPILTFEDLMDEIDRLGEVDSTYIKNMIKIKLQNTPHISIGLYFNKNDRPYWFFYVLVFASDWKKRSGKKNKEKQATRLLKEIEQLNGVMAYAIRLEDLFKRNKGCVADSITDAKVIIVGCGALGSMVAQQLARTGIKKFVLYDYDIIRPGNLVRHTGFFKDIGQNKALVLKNQINDINPFSSVECRGCVLDSKEFDSDVQTSTLVVCCVVDHGVERYVDIIADKYWRPVVYSRVMVGAKVARIFIIEKEETPCFDCLLAMSENEIEPFFKLDENITTITDTGCGGHTYPGTGINHQFAALFTCQMVINRLNDPYYARKVNHILWVSERVEDVPFLQNANSYKEYIIKPYEGCFCRQISDIS